MLEPKPRGIHLITNEVENALDLSALKQGIANLFMTHTSASLAINENADPSVREDLNQFFDRLIPDGTSYLTHNSEGDDDMPAHIKSTIIGTNLNIPIQNGRYAMGIWQGIYLCEHRDRGHPRTIIITAFGMAK